MDQALQCILPALPTCFRDCLPSQHTFHLRFGGPSLAGTSSVIRHLTPDQEEAVQHTDGLEIKLGAFEGNQLVIYDSDDFEEDDFTAAKWVNMTPNSVRLKHPDGIVFVIDGSDRGRLPLAAKVMQSFLETFYRTSVLIILVTKCDLLRGPNVQEAFAAVSEDVSPRKIGRVPTGGGSQSPESPARRAADASKTSIMKEVSAIMSHPSLMQKEWYRNSFASSLSSARRLFYCSAETGDGIAEAMTWLLQTLKAAKKRSV